MSDVAARGVAAIVPAAGQGVRMGAGLPKALLLLAGEPLLLHAVRGLRACADIGPIVVAVPADRVEDARDLLRAQDVTVLAGGAERQDSVRLALGHLPAATGLVVVHDAARALTPLAVVERVIAALRTGAAAVVPALAVPDTLKRVTDDRVVQTVDRADLRAVQTPQGFQRDVLERAHAAGGAPATDDAALVERRGLDVRTVPGDEQAFKVTRPFDLLVAEAVLRERGR